MSLPSKISEKEDKGSRRQEQHPFIYSNEVAKKLASSLCIVFSLPPVETKKEADDKS